MDFCFNHILLFCAAPSFYDLVSSLDDMGEGIVMPTPLAQPSVASTAAGAPSHALVAASGSQGAKKRSRSVAAAPGVGKGFKRAQEVLRPKNRKLGRGGETSRPGGGGGYH